MFHAYIICFHRHSSTQQLLSSISRRISIQNKYYVNELRTWGICIFQILNAEKATYPDISHVCFIVCIIYISKRQSTHTTTFFLQTYIFNSPYVAKAGYILRIYCLMYTDRNFVLSLYEKYLLLTFSNTMQYCG